MTGVTRMFRRSDLSERAFAPRYPLLSPFSVNLAGKPADLTHFSTLFRAARLMWIVAAMLLVVACARQAPPPAPIPAPAPAMVDPESLRSLVQEAVAGAMPAESEPEQIREMVEAALAAATTPAVTREEIEELVSKAVSQTAAPSPNSQPLSTSEVEKIVAATLAALPTPGPEPPEAIPPPTPPSLKNPGTLIHVTIAEPESLDPSWQYDTASNALVFNVYEPLLFYEREKIDEFVPVLSTGWDVSDGGKTYRFTIREGVRFHEGGTLEPHDAAYSIWRGLLQDRAGGPQWVLLEPLLGVSGIEELATQIAGAKSFEEVDAASLAATCERVKQSVTFDDDTGTVTFALNKPFGPFLQILASGWGSVADMEWMIDQGAWDGDCATWTRWRDPAAEESVIFKKMNGTGPFKFERWDAGEEWSIVRNDDYWLEEPLWEGGPSGPPQLERAVAKVVKEWGTRLAMFQAGDADSIFVPRQFVTQLGPMVKEQYEGGESSPSKLTISNPSGTIRVFKGIPTVSSVDAFFTFQVNTEGGNPFVGTGKLDGLGIPSDFFSNEHVRRAFVHAFDYQTFIEDVFLGEASQRSGPIISGHIGHSPLQPVPVFDPQKAEQEFKLVYDGELWDTGFFLVLTYN